MHNAIKTDLGRAAGHAAADVALCAEEGAADVQEARGPVVVVVVFLVINKIEFCQCRINVIGIALGGFRPPCAPTKHVQCALSARTRNSTGRL